MALSNSASSTSTDSLTLLPSSASTLDFIRPRSLPAGYSNAGLDRSPGGRPGPHAIRTGAAAQSCAGSSLSAATMAAGRPAAKVSSAGDAASGDADPPSTAADGADCESPGSTAVEPPLSDAGAVPPRAAPAWTMLRDVVAFPDPLALPVFPVVATGLATAVELEAPVAPVLVDEV